MRLFLLVTLVAGCAFAQDNPLTKAVQSRYSTMKLNMIETAEAMPEADYGYKLSPAQRPFGAWIEHTAGGNYSFCAAMKGAPADSTPKLHDLKTKADLQKALKDSFDYCDPIIAGLDDKKALTALPDGKYPVTAMIAITASLNEHYGNLVGYLRTKGITPPSSARAAKK